MTKSFTDDPVNAGGTVTLEFTITNSDTEAASNIAFTDDLDAALTGLVATDPDRSIVIEMEYYHKDGNTRWLENRVNAIRDDGGAIVGLHGVSRDITERKRMEDALRENERRYRELSIIDMVTQLYNLRQFDIQIKIETDRSNRYDQPLTLLFLDLDDFKKLNDAYGHIEGDKVLKRIGEVIKECLRETDFAYRYGGEEFTVILPMATQADGVTIAERIRTRIKGADFSPSPGQTVRVTASIGVTQYKGQEEIKAFIQRTDRLMYQGKERGKDRVCGE